jgi:hypothetical protein
MKRRPCPSCVDKSRLTASSCFCRLRRSREAQSSWRRLSRMASCGLCSVRLCVKIREQRKGEGNKRKPFAHRSRPVGRKRIHQDSIRFCYRCFDRLLLNGLIQPFQQLERVIGFFNTYRRQYPVSRDVLRETAGQFQNWVVNRSQKWGAPILEAPEDRRDKFLDPISAKRSPTR